MENQPLSVVDNTVPKTLFWVFLPISLLLLTGSGLSAWLASRSLAKELSAPGQVVEMIATESLDSERRPVTYYYPVVAFKAVNGEPQRLQIPEGRFPAAYETGDPVTILYDPNDLPHHVRIQSVSSIVMFWILPSILGVLGAVFFTLAIVMRWALTSSKSDVNPTVSSISDQSL